MTQNVVLLGADPECFLQTLSEDRRRWISKPAFGLFGGSKDKPIPMQGMDSGFFYLEDNAALEFNVPPQKSAADLVTTIGEGRRWLRNNVLVDLNLEFTTANVMELTADYLKDPRSQTVGCLADHDAYVNEGAERKPFDGAALGNNRYAGGHIHVSYNHKVIPAFVAARFLDIYLTLPWLQWDHQGARRRIYGKPGLFRPKSYGLEYRTPSNWWMWQTEGQQTQFLEGAEYFARKSYEPAYLCLLSEAYARFPWDDLRKVVEAEDSDTAEQLVGLANQRFGLRAGAQQPQPGRRRR
jgi:hypothetical protein